MSLKMELSQGHCLENGPFLGGVRYNFFKKVQILRGGQTVLILKKQDICPVN